MHKLKTDRTGGQPGDLKSKVGLHPLTVSGRICLHTEPAPVWSQWGQIPAVCLHPPNLRMSLIVAAVVGTILLVINQLDVLLRGQATPLVWVKIALTFLVPFCVSNYGILIASHRKMSNEPTR
jgi:hypothetical protein